jgi:predicted nuclease of restriction endonuclease-like RecB superfamily
MSALSLADVRWRSRRDPVGGPPLVSVSFLADSDRRTLAVAGGVLGYVSSLLGQPRRSYDADVPVTIAGDRRLGHALAAVCFDWYRWLSPSFADALPAAVAESLSRAGVDSPSALRLRLFDLVNAAFGGYVPSTRRDEALTRLAHGVGLGAAQIDSLDRALTLDAEGEALLALVGEPPSAEDVIARYNRSALAAVLRQATRIVFTLHEPGGGLLRRLYALCRRMGVYCDVERAPTLGDGFRLTLAGPDAVVGPPAAAGPRLAALALHLTRAMGPADGGEAQLILRERPYRLRLDRPMLRLPGLGREEPAAPPDDETESGPDDPSETFDSTVEARLAREFAALRRQRRSSGWRLVREPAPLLASNRVLLPDFALVRGDLRVFVEVAGFWTAGYLAKKRQALEQLPAETRLVLAVAPPAQAALAGLPFPQVPYRETVPVHELLTTVEAYYGDFTMRTRDAAARLTESCVSEEQRGYIAELDLMTLIGCHSPGETSRALADAPPPEGWQYVPGAGLCGPALWPALDQTLRSIWTATTTPFTIAQLRARSADLPLPGSDDALIAVLDRLPGWIVTRGSLFDMDIRPADYHAAAAGPESGAVTAALRTGGGRAARASRRSKGTRTPRPSLL